MFDYIYSDHKSKYTFIKCPTALFTDERFKVLTNDMKLLYMLMLDRTSLSVKNHWYDSAHKVYIHFPVAEIMEKLGVANQKAARLLRGLEEMGLIEREKVGLGKPDRIYVKD
ncbi:MAG: replication initiator protein A, partial [Oscillospiraceae bacterium]|nr:replication initiator protein A [Oscillospiraceae bacterium]